jgi:hypothetical protein
VDEAVAAGWAEPDPGIAQVRRRELSAFANNRVSRPATRGTAALVTDSGERVPINRFGR